jgi:hypothetical protein
MQTPLSQKVSEGQFASTTHALQTLGIVPLLLPFDPLAPLLPFDPLAPLLPLDPLAPLLPLDPLAPLLPFDPLAPLLPPVYVRASQTPA